MSSTDSSGGLRRPEGRPLWPAAVPAQSGPRGPQDLPLVDFAVLAELEEDTGSIVARKFVSDFVGMWTQRIQAVEESLDQANPSSAREALVSLMNSAVMVGAGRLASESRKMDLLAADGDVSAMRRQLPHLKHTGELTMSALVQDYLQRPGPMR